MGWDLDALRTEVWEALGDQDEIDPSTATGQDRLDRAINQGQRMCAFYRTRRGRRVRFENLIGFHNFSSSIQTGTLSAVSNSTFPYSVSLTEAVEADQYNDWVIEMTDGTANGEKRFVTDSMSDGELYVHKAFSTAPTVGDAYKLYKRYWYIFGSSHSWSGSHILIPAQNKDLRVGNFFEVLQIQDLYQEFDLEYSDKDENYIYELTDDGDPTEYRRVSNRIEMDYNVSDERWFRMTYYRGPTEMSASADTPEIPEPFHYGCALWAIEWGFRRSQEPGMKYSSKRDFFDFMETTIGELEVAGELTEGYGELVLRGSRRGY